MLNDKERHHEGEWSLKIKRWRAYCHEFASVDCIVRKLGGAADVKVKQIVEKRKIPRADTTILEEADAFGELVQFGMTDCDETGASRIPRAVAASAPHLTPALSGRPSGTLSTKPTSSAR
jgi:hypothetical protein